MHNGQHGHPGVRAVRHAEAVSGKGQRTVNTKGIHIAGFILILLSLKGVQEYVDRPV